MFKLIKRVGGNYTSPHHLNSPCYFAICSSEWHKLWFLYDFSAISIKGDVGWSLMLISNITCENRVATPTSRSKLTTMPSLCFLSTQTSQIMSTHRLPSGPRGNWSLSAALRCSALLYNQHSRVKDTTHAHPLAYSSHLLRTDKYSFLRGKITKKKVGKFSSTDTIFWKIILSPQLTL